VLVRRVLESWADVAVWEARHLVAKLQLRVRESRAIEVAERRAAEAEVAGLMAAVWCGWNNLGKVSPRESTLSSFASGRGLAPNAQTAKQLG
jgi:hypothetical protein